MNVKADSTENYNADRWLGSGENLDELVGPGGYDVEKSVTKGGRGW
jgi:hypothetical protein